MTKKRIKRAPSFVDFLWPKKGENVIVIEKTKNKKISIKIERESNLSFLKEY